MNALQIITILLWVIIAGIGIYQLFRYFQRRNAATFLTSEEFRKDIRKVQVIDVRERPRFEAGHILGARNIAFTAFKERFPEIRKDQPVYLYDQRTSLSGRAAAHLKKNGYTQIYILKGGYDNWDGKIKKGS
ncbi:rhodanese-like domain-containing protein [Jeotgalibaca sp. MA1X17-3]|uniref:rhodanese-like domain-containing protein n=1 Tax=Jeotgalibaca sp. MA1X17-3 TaxID=2908211 RepID=UPI001F2DF54D|nr:rhodanese-like domain-containing protein [Jeotgalibaca sp. MA1X17-3]UJF14886.1 rhodanese-like domain-containing protein [Jeotgalibaca sp. MA1X17-3]